MHRAAESSRAMQSVTEDFRCLQSAVESWNKFEKTAYKDTFVLNIERKTFRLTRELYYGHVFKTFSSIFSRFTQRSNFYLQHF